MLVKFNVLYINPLKLVRLVKCSTPVVPEEREEGGNREREREGHMPCELPSVR